MESVPDQNAVDAAMQALGRDYNTRKRRLSMLFASLEPKLRSDVWDEMIQSNPDVLTELVEERFDAEVRNLATHYRSRNFHTFQGYCCSETGDVIGLDSDSRVSSEYQVTVPAAVGGNSTADEQREAH